MDQPLIEHVDVKAVDPVRELLSQNLLHHLDVTRIQTEPPDRLAVGPSHFPLWMRLEQVPALLHDAIGNQRKAMFPGLVDGLPQRIAISQTGCLRQEF